MLDAIADFFAMLFNLITGRKQSLAEKLGKSEANDDAKDAEINTLNAEAQAKADAPTTMEQLIAKQKAGDV